MAVTSSPSPAAASGTFRLGGDLPVHRLGFGTMRITGPGVWGEPADPDEAVRVLRRLVELGVTFIDTADSYGPYVSERLIKQALHPYPAHLVIATKGGFTRPGPNMWHPDGRPEHLRRQTELSLRNLGVERIDNLGDHTSEDVLDYCEAENLAFIPWYPIATGGLADPTGLLAGISRSHGATPSQLALAWLLRRSPVILPIPGTSSVAHLEENVTAAAVRLSDEEFETLAAAV
ncbi:aldo/keto reductase [Streptomyces sp. NPDC002520]